MCATVHMWRPKDSFAEYGSCPSTVMCLLWFELTLSGLHSKIPFPVEPSHGPTQRWLLCSVVAGMRGFLICTTHNATMRLESAWLGALLSPALKHRWGADAQR